MAVQLSNEVRNARADAVESTIGTAPLLRIYSGTPPAATTDTATGDLLVEMTLPSDWLSAASSGVKSKAGTWQDTSADGTGTATYFRIYNSAGSLAHMQGTVGMSGSGADLILDNTSITATQSVTITGFTITDGNANP